MLTTTEAKLNWLLGDEQGAIKDFEKAKELREKEIAISHFLFLMPS